MAAFQQCHPDEMDMEDFDDDGSLELMMDNVVEVAEKGGDVVAALLQMEDSSKRSSSDTATRTNESKRQKPSSADLSTKVLLEYQSEETIVTKGPILSDSVAQRDTSHSSKQSSFRSIFPSSTMKDHLERAGVCRGDDECFSYLEKNWASQMDEKKKRAKRDDPDPKERITDVLDRNFASELASTTGPSDVLMEGDFPQLAVRNEFIRSVKQGWPFCEMMPPQRLMALHIIKALQTCKHAVLESPTGTGKSASLLCSILAWQRYHRQVLKSVKKKAAKQKKQNKGAGSEPSQDDSSSKFDTEKVQIIYCSRTHSQVAQMIASLRKTPYRPSMAVLGSRERLCIHEKITQSEKYLNVNNECRARVRNTESQRKNISYEDDDPPFSMDGDDLELEEYQEQQRSSQNHGGGAQNDNDEENKRIKPTCPHYRHLTSKATVKSMTKRFRPSKNLPNTKGDEKRKEGTHDIEDLASFFRDSTTVKPEKGSEKASQKSGSCACPYYVSRSLSKHAEIVFAPYQYVLDRSIRKSMGIQLEGSVVVLDEAHNVEDCLRSSGSGAWSEFELQEMVATLQFFAGGRTIYHDPNPEKQTLGGEMPKRDTEITLNERSHNLILYVERIILFMLDKKGEFEDAGPDSGAQKAIREWKRFRSPDDTSFETCYYGPTGHGVRGQAVGCDPFFDEIPYPDGFVEHSADVLLEDINCIQSYISGKVTLQRYAGPIDGLADLVAKLSLAKERPEHYFLQTTVKPNGSFSFAAGDQSDTNRSIRRNESQQRRRNPKSTPYAHGRSKERSNASVETCQFCREKSIASGHDLIFDGSNIRHANYCNGSKPAWESFLVLDLLSAAHFMEDLLQSCRSVILASGSLAPIPSLCAELGLSADRGPENKLQTADNKDPSPEVSSGSIMSKEEKITKRLQVQPPPLEANHVIDLDKQLMAVAVGHFTDGSRLTVSYQNYKHDDFIRRLGGTIASIVESVPRGGVLVFLPSYSLLRKCRLLWRNKSSMHPFAREFRDDINDDTWERLERSKGKVIVEPTGSQAEFEAARDEYADTIRETGRCVLFAVFRGKMSEGISFNDDNARAVICVGVPFPNSFDRAVKAKRAYNDEQRRLENKTSLLPGDLWYSQQAYRALSQALGRCIRHCGDYGAIFLLDSRHCDESPPDQNNTCRAHRHLPKWMRSHIKTLKMSRNSDPYGKTIPGGWSTLKEKLADFFVQAPLFASKVLQSQHENLKLARSRNEERAKEDNGRLEFDKISGHWTKSKMVDKVVPDAATSLS